MAGKQRGIDRVLAVRTDCDRTDADALHEGDLND
jgi:hypothetical protein